MRCEFRIARPAHVIVGTAIDDNIAIILNNKIIPLPTILVTMRVAAPGGFGVTIIDHEIAIHLHIQTKRRRALSGCIACPKGVLFAEITRSIADKIAIHL